MAIRIHERQPSLSFSKGRNRAGSTHRHSIGSNGAMPSVPQNISTSMSSAAASALSRSPSQRLNVGSPQKSSRDMNLFASAYGSQNAFATSKSAVSAVDASLISQSNAWEVLQEHAQIIKRTHLEELLSSDMRNRALAASFEGIFLDFSHARVNLQTMDLLFDLAEQANVQGRITDMQTGQPVNNTQQRAVLHMALRADPSDIYRVHKENVVPEVHKTLEKIRKFSSSVFSGVHRAGTYKKLIHFLVIGSQDDHRSTEFVYESLSRLPEPGRAAKGRILRFLSNIDPLAVRRALDGLDPRQALVIVVSKSFTDQETMLNAITVRDWLKKTIGRQAASHMLAVSTNRGRCVDFGIPEENIFNVWNWVGDQFTVTSAAGVLPLSLTFGFDIVREFLNGARSTDQNFLRATPRENLALIMGLIGVWDASFLDYTSRAIIPYSEALKTLPPFVQHLYMQSHSKRVASDGSPIDFSMGGCVFGETGTTSQRALFQRLHQGPPTPCDFIGFCKNPAASSPLSSSSASSSSSTASSSRLSASSPYRPRSSATKSAFASLTGLSSHTLSERPATLTSAALSSFNANGRDITSQNSLSRTSTKSSPAASHSRSRLSTSDLAASLGLSSTSISSLASPSFGSSTGVPARSSSRSPPLSPKTDLSSSSTSRREHKASLFAHDSVLSAHDKLMSNFFAQPDALAYGRSESSLYADEHLPSGLIPHKIFDGNRPSISLLFTELNSYTLGQLLALYEHRIVVQGFIWGINNFDNFGDEFGTEMSLIVCDRMLAARSSSSKSAQRSAAAAAARSPTAARVRSQPASPRSTSSVHSNGSLDESDGDVNDGLSELSSSSQNLLQRYLSTVDGTTKSSV